MHEWGGGGLPGGTPMRTPSSEVIVFSVVYTLPICNPRIFSRLRTPGGGGDTPAAPCASIAATDLTLVFSCLCATPLLPSPLFSRDCPIMSGRGGSSSTFNENRFRFYGREKREHGAKQLLFFTTPTRPATSGRARPRAGTGAPLWPAPRWHTRRKRGIRLQ